MGKGKGKNEKKFTINFENFWLFLGYIQIIMLT